jgi:hypothetical protein
LSSGSGTMAHMLLTVLVIIVAYLKLVDFGIAVNLITEMQDA